MATRDIIVIGASAGGVDALQRLCAALPADLRASVFIVQHLSPSSRSVLPQLLSRAGPLPASAAIDGERPERGRIYVAVPDHHLLLDGMRMLVRRGPHENRTRPAANALFRSAALAHGSRVVGVVLTGLLDDGTEGLIAIKAAGGVSVVQEPADAAWASMPRSAIEHDHVDHVAPLDAIAGLLAQLVAAPAGQSRALPPAYAAENRIAAQELAGTQSTIETPGEASRLACPECGGVLNAIDDGGAFRFRCQVGHAFTPAGLAAAQNQELERALGIAVRTHRDRIRLFEQMRTEAAARGLLRAEARWNEARTESEEMLAVLERATIALRRPVPQPD